MRRVTSARASASEILQASRKPLNALLGMAGHDDQAIEATAGSGFEDQRRFDDGNGVRHRGGRFLPSIVSRSQ